MSKVTGAILVVIGCILLAVANVALWATLNLFNAQRFGDHVAEGMQSPAAAEAMAGPLVDALIAEYPDFPTILRLPAQEGIAWLLERPVFTPVFKEAAALASKVMTTSPEDVIGIDLASVIETVGESVVGVVSTIDPAAGTQVQEAIDTALQSSEDSGLLAIYEGGEFPRLRAFSNLAPWIALLAGLGAIALFAVAALRGPDRHEMLKYTGVGILITAAFGFLMFIPALNAPAMSGLGNPVMQAVVGEVVSVFAQSFAIQSLVLFLIGLIVLAVNHIRVSSTGPAPEGTGTVQSA
jgi:hypothetical protein